MQAGYRFRGKQLQKMKKKHSDISWILIQFNSRNPNTLEDENIGTVIFDCTKAAIEVFFKKGFP